MFSGVSILDSFASGKTVVNVKLPSISSVDESEVHEPDEPVANRSVNDAAPVFQLLDKQIPELVTLSLLPKSQWQSLINLDIIKVALTIR